MVMFYFTMDIFYMVANTSIVIYFITTMLTIKSIYFMQGSHMLEKVAFPFSPIITLLTIKANYFMQRSCMLDKFTFSLSFMVSMITTISNFFMQRLYGVFSTHYPGSAATSFFQEDVLSGLPQLVTTETGSR